MAKSLDRLASLHWYALTVPPQKEFAAQAILDRYGLDTYVPVKKEWRRKNKYVKAKVLRQFPEAPRYVFAGFPQGIPLWFDIFNLPIISGVVCVQGSPAKIPFSGNRGIERLMKTYPNGNMAPREFRYMHTKREFKIGDMVEMIDGPFEGMIFPVVDIKGTHAIIRQMVFGSERDISIPIEKLVASE